MYEKFRLEDGPDAATRILVPQGDLGADSVDRVRRVVDEALAAGKRHVVVDLSETDYIETAVLGALLDSNARARRFGATLCAVVPADSRLWPVFATSGLDHVLRVVTSRQDALGST